MLKAQLHGKLSREEERLEDLLTSNVFGTFSYFPPQELLIPFLSQAENLQGERLALEDFAEAEIEFWPWMEEAGCNPAEPDVNIVFTTEEDRRSAILIEAKLYSGKSSAADEGAAPMDQLAREYDNLVHWASREAIQDFSLLLVTVDAAFPTRAIQDAIDEYQEKRGGEANIFWLSWRSVVAVIEPHLESVSARGKILTDLYGLLERRSLVPFRGMTFPKFKVSDLPHWSFTLEPTVFEWSTSVPLPQAYRFRQDDVLSR
jgi:hypothetical protein